MKLIPKLQIILPGLLAAAGLLSCSLALAPPAGRTQLRLDLAGTARNAAPSTLASLQLTLTGKDTAPVSRTLSPDSTASLLLPSGEDRTLTLTAQTAAGTAVAEGSASADLPPGETVSVTVTLEPAVFSVGDRGPAGGRIFYVNPTADTDGWTYLEAAPADLGAPDTTYQMGNDADGTNGIDITETDSGIGEGLDNTSLIVSSREDDGDTSNAASRTIRHSVNGFSDWFLPSIDELNEMHTALKANGLGGFQNDIYWSSTDNVTIDETQAFDFGSGSLASGQYHTHTNYVRPVRRF